MELDKLKAPFAPDKISWRVGSTTRDKTKGMALAYIDARDVQDRLDEICGSNGWQCRYVPMHDKKTVCEIGILVTRTEGGYSHEWVWKADGAGDSDVEAEKGALSDAFKRAAVKWGIGRYLYDLESPWVELEPAGSSFKIKADQYAKLRAVLNGNDGGKGPAPAPNQPTDKPKMTAAEWVEKASAEVLALRTSADMSAWLQKNHRAVDALMEKDKPLYNAINVKIAHRNDELNALSRAAE